MSVLEKGREDVLGGSDYVEREPGQRVQDRPSDFLLFSFRRHATLYIFHLACYLYKKTFAELLINQTSATLHVSLSHSVLVFLKHQHSSALPCQTHSFFSKDTRSHSVLTADGTYRFKQLSELRYKLLRYCAILGAPPWYFLFFSWSSHC